MNAGAMEPPCRTTAMLDTDVLAATTEHVHWMVHGWGMPLFANVSVHETISSHVPLSYSLSLTVKPP